MRVLLVEDNAELVALLVKGLARSGFAADSVGNAGDAAHSLAAMRYSAIVLDLGLPDQDGLSLLRGIRGRGDSTPVLVLTARDGVSDRVNGLRAGADDYLEKPFHIEEVVARLRALARRSAGAANPVLHHRDIDLDTITGRVTCAGRPIDLTAQELKILSYLMHRPTRIVSQGELVDHVYSFDAPRQSNTVEVYVARLRRKLGHGSIRTVRGLGYRLGDEGDAAE